MSPGPEEPNIMSPARLFFSPPFVLLLFVPPFASSFFLLPVLVFEKVLFIRMVEKDLVL